jgi:hypothetical protein
MIQLKAKEVIEITVIRKNGKKEKYIAEGNSPTPELINDIYREMTAPTPASIVEELDKIRLMADVVTILGEATLNAPDFTFDDTTPKFTITKTVPITMNGTISFVKALSVGKLYFETSISPINVTAGDLVVVNWSISLILSLSAPSGIFGGATIEPKEFIIAVNRILGKSRGTRNLIVEQIRAQNTLDSGILLSAAAQRNQTGLTISIPATFFQANGRMNYVVIFNSTSPYRLGIKLANPIDVTTNDRLEVTIYLR